MAKRSKSSYPYVPKEEELSNRALQLMYQEIAEMEKQHERNMNEPDYYKEGE